MTRLAIPRLIGMVHLLPLPGSPSFRGSMAEVVERAVNDALTLQNAGFDAVMVENFGDAPFYAEDVPNITVAGMTAAAASVVSEVEVTVGCNVLRNDGLAAVAIAAATGATMIRVNVLSGTMFTDQGPISSRAADIARLKASLAPHIAVLGDVFVKHAVPPHGSDIGLSARDLWERGGADAVIVSGSGTGRSVEFTELDEVRRAVPDAPILVGSGTTIDTLPKLAALADGFIVGTSLKRDANTDLPVDPELAASFVGAVASER